MNSLCLCQSQSNYKGSRGHEPKGTAEHPPRAWDQRLNNRKHVQHINICADSNLSIEKEGLHKGFRTDHVTKEQAAAAVRCFGA